MRSASQWIERCLWTIGLFALGAWMTFWIGARVHQALGKRELDRRISEPSSAINPTTLTPVPKLSRGDLIGRIDIPRLDLSSVIFEGTDSGVLRDGVGHLTGSALPGQSGNVVLAAHRDTYFRSLRYLHNRDTIDVVTPSATKTYQVFSTEIVMPDQTEVVAPTRSAELTLVTCYPFDWFGHAPKRFIVKAREVEEQNATATSPISPPAPSAPAAANAAEMMQTVDHSPPSKPKPHPAAVHKFKPYTPVAAAPAAAPSVPHPDAQDDEASAIDVIVPAAPSGNRFVRGLKKLNPKGLFAKLAGN